MVLRHDAVVVRKGKKGVIGRDVHHEILADTSALGRWYD
jgi:hypothetical protein